LADVSLVDVPLYREDVPAVTDVKRGVYRDLISAARFFADRARDVEEQAQRADHSAPEFVAVRHRAYVTGSILAAVAFLEASITELYLEFHGTRSRERTQLPRRVAAILGRVWSHVDNAPLLQRYQAVLAVADAERFDERRAPFQDADSLLKLRDALVHCRPERVESRRRIRLLEQRLHQRFAVNLLAPADGPWFPDICLSTACAEWAVQTANTFSDDFCRRMALPQRGLELKDVDARRGTGAHRAAERFGERLAPESAVVPNEPHTRQAR